MFSMHDLDLARALEGECQQPAGVAAFFGQVAAARALQAPSWGLRLVYSVGPLPMKPREVAAGDRPPSGFLRLLEGRR